MALALAHAERSVLLVVDVQPSFMKGIEDRKRVINRSEFLIRMANLLDVPVIPTEQYPSRMGGTEEMLIPLFRREPIGKMTFSCVGCEQFDAALAESGRDQAVMVGIETHICVSQTAHHLLQQGKEVLVCADAVGARTELAHEIGLRRLANAGAVVAHTESIAYEWMRTAEHEKFRDALSIVKEYS